MSLDERIAAAQKRIYRLVEREKIEVDPVEKKALQEKLHDDKIGIFCHGLISLISCLNSCLVLSPIHELPPY